MGDTAIRVCGLSKVYKIGAARPSGDGLRHAVEQGVRRLGRRLLGRGEPPPPAEEDFWALKDVSFDVRRGECVGVIGRNGAGKSTLLKILSRITEPTDGEIGLRGRVGSLLEVGTGFHPELTGRENVYLNGSVLGMSRREINAKFDEIVAFSEIEKFLDTPVKRYSSGMYVRLAFAVAAHLEPEILIVDEVLAVGDIGFQAKCLDKIRRMRGDGRTVLFVSHHMGTVSQLCQSVVRLEKGRVVQAGEARRQVEEYVKAQRAEAGRPVADRRDRTGDGSARILDAWFAADGRRTDRVVAGQPVDVLVRYSARTPMRNPVVHIALYNEVGDATAYTNSGYQGIRDVRLTTDAVVRCRVANLDLLPGHYYLNVCLCEGGAEADHVESATDLVVEAGDRFGHHQPHPSSFGQFLPRCSWHQEAAPEAPRD
jgi:lipopolysaccharide transport system ATP-binding protein